MGSIYDNKGEFFMTPHFFKSSADFIRNIQVEAKNPQSMLNKFPADYELHIIGSYDEMTKYAGSIFAFQVLLNIPLCDFPELGLWFTQQ